MSYYLSKNKKGKVLVYDSATKKPIRRELSFEFFDFIFEYREEFFQSKFKYHFDTDCESLEEELQAFKDIQPFYFQNSEFKDLF